jgi:4-hydroxythreonine-4-phosphate dehydrogenase
MLPTLAITSGEAAGIGPELCVKLVQQLWPARLLFIADPKLLIKTARHLCLPLEITIWQPGSEIPEHQVGNIHCVALDLAEEAVPGKLNTANSSYVLKTLQTASDLCLNKTVQGVVTGPVHKAIINDAGIPFSGHTEFFCKLRWCRSGGDAISNQWNASSFGYNPFTAVTSPGRNHKRLL